MIECYEISAAVVRDLSERDAARVASACRAAAASWAKSHKVEFDVVPIDTRGQIGDEPRIGVSWEVVVGRAGTTEASWAWSARWRHWLAVFRALDLRERSADMDASITQLDSRRT